MKHIILKPFYTFSKIHSQVLLKEIGQNRAFDEYERLLQKKLLKKFLLDGATWCGSQEEVRIKAIESASKDGLFLEFGVHKGTSINFLSERIEGIINGFDSFEGLPEGDGVWERYYKEKSFDLKGNLPSVHDNVRLHKGWIEDTLPHFLEQNSGPVSFAHIDTDIYSTARTILTLISERVQAGTVLLFDEFFNYDGWQHQEFKAFTEFITLNGMNYRFIAFGANKYRWGAYGKVALVIT